MQVTTVYFFAGGRARSPSENEDAYSWFFLTRFSWIGVAIVNEIVTRKGDEKVQKNVPSEYTKCSINKSKVRFYGVIMNDAGLVITPSYTTYCGFSHWLMVSTHLPSTADRMAG